jgi:hypothetical protein
VVQITHQIATSANVGIGGCVSTNHQQFLFENLHSGCKVNPAKNPGYGGGGGDTSGNQDESRRRGAPNE